MPHRSKRIHMKRIALLLACAAVCLHAIVFTNNFLFVGLFRRVFLIVLAAAR